MILDREILRRIDSVAVSDSVILADGFQITCLYDHHSTFLDLSPLMLTTCDFFDGIAMLIEARQIAAFRDKLDLIKSGIGDQDRDERGTILHGEAHAANSLPRGVPNW